MLVVYQTVGWMALSLGQLGISQYDMAVKLRTGDGHEFETLRFLCRDFEQIRLGKKEFRWNGHQYDIAGITAKGDSLWVHAIKDEHETRLLAQLGHFVRFLTKNTSRKTNCPSLPAQLLHPVYLIPESPASPLVPAEDRPLPFFCNTTTRPLQGVDGVLTPPPEA